MKHTRTGIAAVRRGFAGTAPYALAFALAATACGGSQPAETAPVAIAAARPISDDVTRTTFATSLGVHVDQMMRRASGLYVQDIKVGTGAIALNGKSMVVRYAGYLSDGTKFDSGEITVTVGSSNTIAAWKEGLVGMRVGGIRRLVVPPNLGYGSAGAGSTIPPYAVLVFDIEMTAAI